MSHSGVHRYRFVLESVQVVDARWRTECSVHLQFFAAGSRHPAASIQLRGCRHSAPSMRQPLRRHRHVIHPRRFHGSIQQSVSSAAAASPSSVAPATDRVFSFAACTIYFIRRQRRRRRQQRRRNPAGARVRTKSRLDSALQPVIESQIECLPDARLPGIITASWDADGRRCSHTA